MTGASPYSRQETSGARLDRNFNEQLQELRIAQAGVQILFAFLLVIPFQNRFEDLTSLQRNIYVVTLIAAALSVILFTAPVAMHRVLFREGVKDFIVRYTAVLISAGLTTLALSILGGVVLVLDLLLSHTTALVIGGLIAGLAVMLWLVVPLRRRARTRPGKAQRDGSDERTDDESDNDDDSDAAGDDAADTADRGDGTAGDQVSKSPE